MLWLLLSCSGSEPVDTAPPVDWDALSVREKCFEGVGDALNRTRLAPTEPSTS